MLQKKWSLYILSIPLLTWIVVVFLLDFNGLYGQDAHEYYRYGCAITEWLRTGTPPGDYFWPLMYPLLAGVAGLIVPGSFPMQLISLLAFAGLALYSKKWLELLYGDKTAFQWIYLTVVLLLSPYMLRMSLLSMSDMTAACFTTAAAYHLFQFHKSKHGMALLAGIAFTALAFHSRYGSVILLIPPLLLALNAFLQRPAVIALGGGIMLAVLVSLPHLLLRSDNSLEFLGHSWLQNWSPLNFFRSSFVTIDGAASYPLPNLLYAFSYLFHPVYGMLLLATVPFYRKLDLKDAYIKTTVAAILLYSIFLAGIPFQNKRFLLTGFPFVALLFYPLWNGLISFLSSKNNKKIYLTACTFLQLILFGFSIQAVLKLNRLERNIAAALKELPRQDIYGFELDIALRTYLPDRQWHNLWVKEYDTFEKGSLVIFNEKKLSRQWEGRTPMINWNKLKKQNELRLIASFEQEWKLYEIR